MKHCGRLTLDLHEADGCTSVIVQHGDKHIGTAHSVNLQPDEAYRDALDAGCAGALYGQKILGSRVAALATKADGAWVITDAPAEQAATEPDPAPQPEAEPEAKPRKRGRRAK